MSEHGGERSAVYLGVDGGGTKTAALLIDQDRNVIGEGSAGPSNPGRVGMATAAANVSRAVLAACAAANVDSSTIAAARLGLAGTRQADVRRQMSDALRHLKIGQLIVSTDARVALYGAAGGSPAVVIIAGTGSNCCGLNALKKQACAGGWGPVAGDEGSGVWIARRALQLIAQATDGRRAQTSLVEAAFRYFRTSTPDDLLAAIYAPEMTNDRIAGFGREVVATARDEGDATAREIIAAAGHDLGQMVATVVRRLGMQREHFPVACVGGVFAAGEMLTGPLRAVVARVAPEAYLAGPKFPPTLAAALMALESHRQESRVLLAG